MRCEERFWNFSVLGLRELSNIKTVFSALVISIVINDIAY